MSEYIKLEDAIGIIQNEIDEVKIRDSYDGTFRLGLRLAKEVLRDLPTTKVSEDCIDRYSALEPPEDKTYILNDKGAVLMNFATFQMVLIGEITFPTIITRRKFEREEKAARSEKKTPISPPTLQCNDCTRYFYCAWDKEGCPRYKPREPEKEGAEE